jgi:hypothetical protein
MTKDYWLSFVAVVSGALIWALVASASGRSEAWDSGMYFAAGIPAGCLLSFALALIEPQRSWRWGVLPMVGQLVWLLLTQGVGNLLPLGVIVFGVLSIPGIIAARIGASMAMRRKQNTNTSGVRD